MSLKWCWWRTSSNREIDESALTSALRKMRANEAPGQMVPLTQSEYLAITTHTPLTAEQSIIAEIFSIRVKNNVPWKRLMEIALKHAPEETRVVLREINDNDRKVSALLGELAK